MAAGSTRSWQDVQTEFHLMVGYCITDWARVDDSLFAIFRACLGPIEQSAIIYYRTPALDLRFKLTDELVLSVLPKRVRKSGGHDHPDVKAWKKAIEGHSDLLSVRRRIAHHPVDATYKTGPHSALIGAAIPGSSMPGNADLVPSFEIYASAQERLRSKEKNEMPLGVGDLKTHRVQVNQLRDRLHAFLAGTFAAHAKVSPP
jgi:hypothetical protein